MVQSKFFVKTCHQKGFKEVRIIHGRGTGVQRKIVRSYLEKSPLVLAFKDAPAEAGGWGATMVQLKYVSPANRGSSSKGKKA